MFNKSQDRREKIYTSMFTFLCNGNKHGLILNINIRENIFKFFN